VLHSRLIEVTIALASTCPTTFFAAYTDFTLLSLPARRRRRWGVDLETVRSSVVRPGCDTRSHLSDGQPLIWCSTLCCRVCALITFTLASFASSLYPSACVHDKLVAGGQSYWLVEYITKGEASLKAFADCRARAAALRYLNSMVVCVVGVYSSSPSPFALDLLTLLLHTRTDPIYSMSGTSRVCLRQPIEVTSKNIVSLPVPICQVIDQKSIPPQ